MICVVPIFSQEKGFFFKYNDTNHSWFPRDAIETDEGDFIIGVRNNWGNEAQLLKLSHEGTLITVLPIVAEDTIVLMSRLLHLPSNDNGDYVAFCPCHPSDTNNAALLFVRFDSDLNVLMRKAVSCPFVEPGDRFFDVKATTLGNTIVASFTTKQGTGLWGPTFLTKINAEGVFLDFQRCDRISTVCSLFQLDENGDCIGLFGKLPGVVHRMGILTFDETLSLITSDTLSQWQNPEGCNGDYVCCSIADYINSQALSLSDGTVGISAKLDETLCHPNGAPYDNYDNSTVLAKYDIWETPVRFLITEHMNDSIEEPAYFRSVDVGVDDNSCCFVFQCVNLNIRIGPLQPYPAGCVVIKSDQNLNVVWKKRFLRDENYQAMVINATSDGGCLVIGSFGDYQSHKYDVFALKINADGTVGVDEIQEESMAFVYPNPAKETIRIGGVEAKETQVCNVLGQCVMSFLGNEANVQTLAAGVYLLKITDHEGVMQTLHLVVE